MEEIHVNSLLEKSKEKKKEKLYEEEKKLLEEAHRINSTNLKVLNALLRNIRRTGTIEELYEVLLKIYKLNPNSNILYELIITTRKMGNTKLERYFLEEKLKYDKNDSKTLKRLRDLVGVSSSNVSENKRSITKEEFSLISKIRILIYSDISIEEKKRQILDLVVDLDEDYQVALLTELYKHDYSDDMAKKFIKDYKKRVESDERKTRFANILMGLVQTKKTNKMNWNEFWLRIRNTKDNKNNITLSK